MNITTEFHAGDSGLTIEVDGIQVGTDPEVVAAFVSDAVAEALYTLWVPPRAGAVQAAAAEIASLP